MKITQCKGEGIGSCKRCEDLSCSNRHPIKLWKEFLITLEEETVKYMRRYEKCRK